MVFMTRTVTPDHTPLMVSDFYSDGVEAKTPDGESIRVPRNLIETPRLYCTKCGMPVLCKHDKRTNKDYAECPNHARHMYEGLFAASKDEKQFSRKTRRQFHEQAGAWLRKWRRKVQIEHNASVGIE